MFENSWSANLATFSVILEETTDDKISKLCIEAFMHSIKICGYFNMTVERDAFVSSLAKFTQVNTNRPIQAKHMSCIKALLALATNEGNYLGQSWYFVLDCISKIEEMHQLGTGQV
jgi:brefeldin A-inhibited guanine nucleotide-exchange protein